MYELGDSVEFIFEGSRHSGNILQTPPVELVSKGDGETVTYEAKYLIISDERDHYLVDWDDVYDPTPKTAL